MSFNHYLFTRIVAAEGFTGASVAEQFRSYADLG